MRRVMCGGLLRGGTRWLRCGGVVLCGVVEGEAYFGVWGLQGKTDGT